MHSLVRTARRLCGVMRPEVRGPFHACATEKVRTVSERSIADGGGRAVAVAVAGAVDRLMAVHQHCGRTQLRF